MADATRASAGAEVAEAKMLLTDALHLLKAPPPKWDHQGRKARERQRIAADEIKAALERLEAMPLAR